LYANSEGKLIIIRTLKQLIVIIQQSEQLIDCPSLFYPYFLHYESVASRQSLSKVFLATRERKLVLLDLFSSSPFSLFEVLMFSNPIKKIIEIDGFLISSDFLSKIAILDTKANTIVQSIIISNIAWSNRLYDLKTALIINTVSIITLDLDLNIFVY